MIVQVKQKSKELFSADFDIVRNDEILGTLALKGNVVSSSGTILIKYNNHQYNLHPASFDISLKEKLKAIFTTEGPRHPCDIFVDGLDYGDIYYDQCIRISKWEKDVVCKLFFDSKEYWMYFIGRGYEDCYRPIYHGDKQIGLITSPMIIHNDLYTYTIYMDDDYDVLLGILYIAYIYAQVNYQAGLKIVDGVTKMYSLTTSPIVIEKARPDFIEKIKP